MKHTSLLHRYTEEIRSWNWDIIKKECEGNLFWDEYMDPDSLIGTCILGTVFTLLPSGKYYTSFTTSHTFFDIVKDELYHEILAIVAEEYGLYIRGNDHDPCDLCAHLPLFAEDFDDRRHTFVLQDNYEEWKEFCANNLPVEEAAHG